MPRTSKLEERAGAGAGAEAGAGGKYPPCPRYADLAAGKRVRQPLDTEVPERDMR